MIVSGEVAAHHILCPDVSCIEEVDTGVGLILQIEHIEESGNAELERGRLTGNASGHHNDQTRIFSGCFAVRQRDGSYPCR